MARNKGLSLGNVGKRGAFNKRLAGGSMKEQSGLQISPPRKGGFTQRRSDGISSENNNSKARVVFAMKALLGVIAAFALAIGVGVFVYQQTVKNAIQPEINMQSLNSGLTVIDESEQTSSSSTDTGQASWTLFVRTSSETSENGRGDVKQLGLFYLQPSDKTFTCLWIPANTRIYIDGYGYHKLGEVLSLQNEAGLLAAVKKLCGIEINHYVEINQGGVGRLIPALSLAVDPSSDDNYAIMSELISKVVKSSSEQISTQASTISSYVSGDMSSSVMAKNLQRLRGMDAEQGFRSADMPVIDSAGDTNYSYVDGEAWGTMVKRVQSSMTPNPSELETSSNEQIRSSHKVTIWNGVGVSGVASDCKNKLQKVGWKIESTGNAAQFVYTETLIVYKETEDRAIAELLVSDLGQGRIVRSAARYNFDGDVLVVVGSNYQPY